METIELPLFNASPQAANLQVQSNKSQSVTNDLYNSHENSVSAFLDKLFPEQEYRDKKIKRALSILGELTDKLTIDEIRTIVVEVEYLCDSLLDSYERQIFEGKTLQELLNEG